MVLCCVTLCPWRWTRDREGFRKKNPFLKNLKYFLSFGIWSKVIFNQWEEEGERGGGGGHWLLVVQLV